MILTDKAKEDFLKWYEIRNDNTLTSHELLYLSEDIIQNAIIIEWLDSAGIYITVEAQLGGGAVVFYPQVEYLNEDFINIFDCPKWDDGYQWYSTSRQEATEAAIQIANEIYNQQMKDESKI